MNPKVPSDNNHSLKARAFSRGKVWRKPAANRRADEQKRHRRLRPLGKVAQHNETLGSRGTVNDAVAAGEITVLSRENCTVAGSQARESN